MKSWQNIFIKQGFWIIGHISSRPQILKDEARDADSVPQEPHVVLWHAAGLSTIHQYDSHPVFQKSAQISSKVGLVSGPLKCCRDWRASKQWGLLCCGPGPSLSNHFAPFSIASVLSSWNLGSCWEESKLPSKENRLKASPWKSPRRTSWSP